ncbi:MAG: hypothetical protein HY698_21460 [Deltaproteobacteria bacterium]|nr:hypothetical protein [Deltaproteobacteria bacterium]
MHAVIRSSASPLVGAALILQLFACSAKLETEKPPAATPNPMADPAPLAPAHPAAGTPEATPKKAAGEAMPANATVAVGAGPAGQVSGRLVSKGNKFLADSVVYIEEVKGKFRAPTGPSVIDQKGSTFIPRVLPVLKGTRVVFDNGDAIDHNVYSPDNEKFDLGIWKSGGKSRVFRQLGVYTNLCKLHPTMISYILVLQNPYYAVTDADGAFSIKDVPPGTYKLRAWNERLTAEVVDLTIEKGQSIEVVLPLRR